ncbi:metallophosphoesterase [Ulvibacterium sp.]|uniref:metallophosphoesterase family protein n=1 Tax=Ulvibacterium sp. TaxID=2665914 RepID=UPI00260E1335|nr:metallophosphoesterase [Ulvibacterium sp.]
MYRRHFIKNTGKASMLFTLPLPMLKLNLYEEGVTQIGIVSDVHQDIIPDGYARLRYFMDDMKERIPDFIIQLGDFALPRKQNQPFLDVWNEFEGPAYHVLGNHDMRDFGFTKGQTMDWWRMKDRYYSFDKGGFHFIVLDGNDKNPAPWNGYDRYIGDEQKQWLSNDLAGTNKPTIVFIHQSLEADTGIANKEKIRAILENNRLPHGGPKVIACLSGHHHTDYMKMINGIPYIQINSMSYRWVGGDYNRERFAPHIEHAYPTVKSTCPYRNPLYTVLTLDPKKGSLHIEGCVTQYMAPTPEEIGYPDGDKMSPTITERTITFEKF